MKRIIICADDYGQNKTISQAIVTLLKSKTISATSCLVTSPEWPESAPMLKPVLSGMDIGLHFNLTWGNLLTAQFKSRNLSRLILASYLQRIAKIDVIRELHAQLDAFEKHLNFTPDFIDGHQHVHVLPVIRDALIEVYQTRLQKSLPYIRCPLSSHSFKGQIIKFIGARKLRTLLEKFQIPHNQTFSGIYNFAANQDYAKIFSEFLDQIKDNGIIMCHPGDTELASNDEIALSRKNEFNFFLNSAPHLLIQKNCYSAKFQKK